MASAVIYVLWHREFSAGESFAAAIFRWFRLPSGSGIPVFYRVQPAENPAEAPPFDIPLTNASPNLIVLLVDENMVADYAWRDELVRLAAVADPLHTILYPVAFHPSAYKLPAEIRQLNFISPHPPSAGRGSTLAEGSPQTAEERLLKRLTEAFARVLVRRDPARPLRDADAEPPKIKVFLSHAKADGTAEARALRDYIYQETQLSAFFDENDIALGYKFSLVLEETLRNETVALIAIQGDRYADRPWCRREIRLFRNPIRSQRRPDIWKLHPVLLVEAMQGQEISRAIPQLGNAPAIRWREGDEHRYVDALLRETILRAYHLQLAYGIPAKPGRVILNWSPDPLSLRQALHNNGDTSEVVYPDGGLAGLDLDELVDFFPAVNFLTYQEARA